LLFSVHQIQQRFGLEMKAKGRHASWWGLSRNYVCIVGTADWLPDQSSGRKASPNAWRLPQSLHEPPGLRDKQQTISLLDDCQGRFKPVVRAVGWECGGEGHRKGWLCLRCCQKCN